MGNRASVLLPDVLRSELKVDHGSLNLRVTHELHQRREADACPEPRLSPQNRPYIITSKPANEVSRRTEVLFYHGPLFLATKSASSCRMAEGDN